MSPKKVEDLDDVWRALGNAFRRSILDVLKEQGPLSTGALADALGENRFVVMQHLQVLREARLVLVRQEGRSCINQLNTVPIEQIHQRWISGYAGNWAGALVGLKTEMETRTTRQASRTPQNSAPSRARKAR